MLRKNFKQFLAASMAFLMLFTTNAFATPIDLVNSAQDVKNDTLNQDAGTTYYDDESTNEWSNGTISEEARVRIELASKFDITIPKEIILDGSTGKADYIVNAKGDIAGDQVLKVEPDNEFLLSEKGGKEDITATVVQPNIEYVYTDLQGDGTDYDGVITATLSAGEWSGKFNFNINFKDKNIKSLEEYSWDEITQISEAGLADEYFNIGDEKKVTLNTTSTANVNTLTDTGEGETYTLQIIGFNHDDLVDEEGNLTDKKAGITFIFKDCIDLHYMNPTNTNIGGWRDSDLRKYINNNIYNMLPENLKNTIKEVSKKSRLGHGSSNIITTNDKLFLLAISEISNGWGTNFNLGERYEFYPNDNSYSETRVKKYNNSVSNWWLRESGYNHSYNFAICGNGLLVTSVNASSNYGVAPAFCI